MKALKYIFGVIIGIIVLVLVVAALAPKDYAVEREITIDKPLPQVFNYIKYLKNQDNYSVWATMDPEMKKSFRGTDGEVGFVSAWESDKEDVGKGEQEIMSIDEGKRINFELRFMEPFEATDNAYMITQEVAPTITKVKWGFYGSMDYPMNLMLIFVDMEGILGADLQKGLENLKKELE
ncbi:MAG: polyketide cyclase [Marinilabiliales bacterium]|nr:MAG: polyketide cyclase [Marinilabiliales bacterium]